MVQLLDRTYWAIATRMRRLASERDRGDSPIPSTVIIVGMALLAIGLLVWLGTYVSDLIANARTDIPEPSF